MSHLCLVNIAGTSHDAQRYRMYFRAQREVPGRHNERSEMVRRSRRDARLELYPSGMHGTHSRTRLLQVSVRCRSLQVLDGQPRASYQVYGAGISERIHLISMCETETFFRRFTKALAVSLRVVSDRKYLTLLSSSRGSNTLSGQPSTETIGGFYCPENTILPFTRWG